MTDFEWHDRYTALGIPYPDPETMCHGQCEGTGWVPIHRNETDPIFKTLWENAEREAPTDDNYHFVKCPDCEGTGKRSD